MLCEYGCNKEAKYQFKNGKWCCSKSRNSCPNQKLLNSINTKNIKKSKPIKLNNSKNLCSYGCGQLANYYFENSNKYCCSVHYKKCINERNKNSKRVFGCKNPMYGKTHTEKYKSELKRKIGNLNPMYGKTHTQNVKDNLSSRMKGNKLFKNRHHSEETKNKIRNKLKGLKHSKETIEKFKISNYGFENGMYGKKHNEESKYKMKLKAKIRFKNPNFLKKWISSITSPEMNKSETLIMNILNELFLNLYKFTGNYTFWINGKNPDFTNIDNKKVIEYFGDWWHSEKRTGISENIEDYDRIKHFNINGYECLIIRQKELNDIKRLKHKILEFNNE